MTRPSGRETEFRILEAPLTGPIADIAPLAGPDVRKAVLYIVTPDYFETLRIPILAGRDFIAADRLGEPEIDDHAAPRGTGVAIVSESFARREWPRGGAIGRYLAISSAAYRSVEVIGIAADVRTAPGVPPDPAIYLPYAQIPFSDVTVLVRAAGNPLALAVPLREKLRAFGTDVSAFNMQTMEEIVTDALARPRFNSAVMSWFGAAGLLFTAAGLYTLLSFIVAQRTRELAVRIAIGAGRPDIIGLVVRRGLYLTLAGVAIGVGAALLATRTVRSAIPDLESADPWSLVAVAVLVVAAASLASYVPARRATRVDPIAALRAE